MAERRRYMCVVGSEPFCPFVWRALVVSSLEAGPSATTGFVPNASSRPIIGNAGAKTSLIIGGREPPEQAQSSARRAFCARRAYPKVNLGPSFSESHVHVVP